MRGIPFFFCISYVLGHVMSMSNPNIDKMLKKLRMEQSMRGFIPITHGITLSKSMCPKTQDEKTRMSLISYASAIGSIMYATVCLRPNVSYALSGMSRYQSDPGEGHWVAVTKSLST